MRRASPLPRREGTHRTVGVAVLPDGAVQARVWAPYARDVAIVLEGTPSVRHPSGTDVLAPGDVAAFPIGPDGAHKVFNASNETVRFIMLSTKGEPFYAVYPDSNKMQFGNGRERAMVRLGETLDYYDGEL